MHDSWAPARRREGEFVWVFMLEAALSHRARVWFWCSLSVGGCVFARIHVFVCTCVWWEDWWKKLEARSSAQLATGISWPRHFHVSCLARSSPLLFLRLFFFSLCLHRYLYIFHIFVSILPFFYLLSIFWWYFLPLPSVIFAFPLLFLSLHIFPYLLVTPPPPLLPPPPSLSVVELQW